jgi:hypothetical protein
MQMLQQLNFLKNDIDWQSVPKTIHKVDHNTLDKLMMMGVEEKKRYLKYIIFREH